MLSGRSKPLGVVRKGDGQTVGVRVALGQHVPRLTAKHVVVDWKDFASCWLG